jgi:hypothetical protein
VVASLTVQSATVTSFDDVEVTRLALLVKAALDTPAAGSQAAEDELASTGDITVQNPSKESCKLGGGWMGDGVEWLGGMVGWDGWVKEI